MSTMHTIEIILASTFEEKNIHQIYKNAQKHCMAFFTFSEKADPLPQDFLSQDDFYNYVANAVFDDGDFPGMLWLQIENTILLCSLSSHDNHYILLHTTPHLSNWNSSYQNITDSLDYQRYTRSLLHLCMGFPIKSIETYSIG